MDQAEFELQLQRMLPDLFHFALSLTGQIVDAEDLVHDSCVQALLKYRESDFANHHSTYGWVRQILLNLFRDRVRRLKRAPMRLCTCEDEWQYIMNVPEQGDCTPESVAQSSGFTHLVLTAVQTLSPEVRLAVMLYMVEELSYQEIAEATDSPIGSVMSRLYRGRRTLRRLLGPDVEAMSFTPLPSCVSGDSS